MFLRALTVAASLVSGVWATAHQVAVGNTNGSISYTPNNFKADINDTVIFIYVAGSHTVTKTSFSDPCSNTAASAADDGFDSGPRPVGSNFTITVTTPEPIWIRCDSHCIYGMVGAINAPDSGNETFAAFQAGAQVANYSTVTTSTPSSTTSTSSTAATTSHGAALSQFARPAPSVAVFAATALLLSAALASTVY